MTVTLIYETHSTTLDNERGIATGWLPGELSEAGPGRRRSWGRGARMSTWCSVPTCVERCRRSRPPA